MNDKHVTSINNNNINNIFIINLFYDRFIKLGGVKDRNICSCN